MEWIWAQNVKTKNSDACEAAFSFLKIKERWGMCVGGNGYVGS